VDAQSGAGRREDLTLASLIALFSPIIVSICNRRLAGTHGTEIDDAIQETMTRLAEADRSRIRNPGAWVAVVASHVCDAVYRRRYRQPEVALDEIPFEVEVDDPAEVATDELWLESVGSRLEPRDAKLLRWLYVDRLSYAQVAEQLHITRGYARVLSLRARRHARDTLADFDL